MIRYVLAASALKMFSSTPTAKKFYRFLGNQLGARKRKMSAMPRYYFERIRRMLALSREFGMIQDGYRLLEIGTGWLHWDTVTTKMFFDIEAVMFDVWDNRQLAGLQNFTAQLEGRLPELDANPTQMERAREVITIIKTASSYEELYSQLGFTYLVDAGGTLERLESSSFDIVVSSGVLEHIVSATLPEITRGIARVLKPGGYSMHTINLRDHLWIYDKKVSPKQYLLYPEQTWQRWFENEVQYINRVQRPEWLRLFDDVGLQPISVESDRLDVRHLLPAASFRDLDQSDLECVGLRILHKKTR